MIAEKLAKNLTEDRYPCIRRLPVCVGERGKTLLGTAKVF